MGNKKAFTLAEILIVLMVIGVIAMLTIPSVMKGVNEAQYKAGYKKAYNTIVNLTAMEKTAGALPTKPTPEQIGDYYQMLVNNMSVRYFVKFADDNTGANTSGNKAKAGPTNTCVTIEANNVTLGNKKADGECLTASKSTGFGDFPWIVTDDGIAYTIMAGSTEVTKDCGTKTTINAQASHTDAVKSSCVVIIADVNGLSKGPNVFEKQTLSDGTSFLGDNVASSGTSMTQLIGDDYYIFVGSDGAAAGNPSTTISGRIVSDLK